MNQNDLKLYVTLFESVLQVKELQVAATQMMIGEFEKLHALLRVRRQLQQTPDCPEKTALTAKLDRLEFEFDSGVFFDELKPLIAQSSSELECMHELLRALKDEYTA